MIETPAAAVTFTETDEPDNTLDKEQKEALLESSAMIEIVPMKPITAKLRTTLRHLTSQAGRTSRWRGIVPAIVYSILVSISFSIFSAIVPQRMPVRMSIVRALAALPLARLHMAWTHAMISMPSEKNWYQRLAPFSAYKQLWLPTIVANMAAMFAGYAILLFTNVVVGPLSSLAYNVDAEQPIYAGQLAASIGAIVAIIGFAIFCALFIVLPAHVTLVRIEASMLPEEHETIVPFDRTFGGKVTPKILGGSGAIGFIDAWRTFNWEARRRVLKIYIKSFMIQTFLIFTAVHVVALEVYAIMGKDLKHFFCQMKKYQKEHQQ